MDDINRVIDEGMSRSQVMTLAHELVDGIGGRLTNSPQMRAAERWAEDLRQAAIVMAGMLLTAANAGETLPRVPIPSQRSPIPLLMNRARV